MDGLTPGRIVHIVDPDSMLHLAAIVVHVHDKQRGLVNLVVFDNGMQSRHAGLRTSVPHGDPTPDARPSDIRWHFPERA